MKYKVYMHVNRVNGKIYIGQTGLTLNQRFGPDLANYKSCRNFYRAIEKYGADAFDTEILYVCVDIEEANRLETLCIARWDTLAPNGYNLHTGGKNYTPSEETRQRISEARKGKKGIKHKPETIEKIREWNKGKFVSDETREKIRQARTGTKASAKALENMSKAQSGKTLSPEHRQKIGETHKGMKRSAKALQNMSEAQKRRWRRHRNNPDQLTLFDLDDE